MLLPIGSAPPKLENENIVAIIAISIEVLPIPYFFTKLALPRLALKKYY